MANEQQSGSAALFIQIDPAEEYEYLTCVGVGAVTLPRRAQEVTYCPAVEYGEFEPSDFVAGEMTEATMEMVRPLYNVYNYLLELNCRFNNRLNWGCRGDRPVLTNYELSLLFITSIFTTGTIDGGAVVLPADNKRVGTTGSLKGLKWAFLRQLSGVRQAIAATQGVNDIAFLPEICYSKCSSFVGLGQIGYAVLDSDYLGMYGDTVLHTHDYGGAWTATPTSPFNTLGRNATSVVVVVLPNDEHRTIVGGGASPATWPEIGYSDDEGLNWTNVNPCTVGHGGDGVNALHRDRLGRIWAALDDGVICVSTDQGATWAIAEDAVETGEDLNGIAFYTEQIGYAVGDNNAMLKTTDGGDTWDLILGPAATFNLLSVAVNYLGHVFVSTNDARLFRSVDSGTTWVAILDLLAGSIDRVKFDPKLQYVGCLVHNDAAARGTMHRSEDGGVSWRAIATPANNGLGALFVCDLNTVDIGGEVVGTTGFIAKFTGQV